MTVKERGDWHTTCEKMSLVELARLFKQLNNPISDRERERLFIASFYLTEKAEETQ